MKIAITGGGTGGHLSIAQAIAHELTHRGTKAIFIGSTNGQDRQWFAHSKLFAATYFLPSSGVVNKKGVHKLPAIASIIRQAWHARRLLRMHTIDAVMSVGGYSAAPASIAAILSGIPLFIHEQNASMGSLNRLLSPFAKRLFSSFFPPYDPYPVREEFFAKRRIRSHVHTIIFLGGSQGAMQINDIAMQLAPWLSTKGIHIIHQTGKNDYERIKNFYHAQKIKVDCFAFDPNLADKIAAADLAISRAGASTLWELAANALPAIFVPYPYAAGNHQYHNAAFLVKCGAGWLWGDVDVQSIIHCGVEKQSRTLTSLTHPHGAAFIVDEMKRLIQ